MNQAYRMPEGGCIDRSSTLSFRFNGRHLTGHPGDSLASALLAHGIHFVGRSFRYHRPRGIFSAGEEEPCALVETGSGAQRTPTCRAPAVALVEGLEARSQNCWPSLHTDLARILDYSHRLWPAGFYNKTFKWPNWNVWEGLVRHAAGLGRCPTEADPDHYEQLHAHCDLLVCGAGPAGLLGSLMAARAGMRVIVVEQDRQLGGSLQRENIHLDGKPASAWVREVEQELRSLPRVTVLTDTTMAGIYDHNVTTLVQRGNEAAWRECLWTVRPRHVLLASGTIEQGLIFRNNDRPGTMLAGAARAYLNQYAVAAGNRLVITCNNDSAYQTARDFHEQGRKIVAIIDSRKQPGNEAKKLLGQLGVPLFTSARISNTRGSKRIRQVSVQTLEGKSIGHFGCDLLAVSGGWAPRVHLLCHARGALRFDDKTQCFLPDRLPAGFSVTGAVAGVTGLSATFASAADQIQAISAGLGFKAHPVHQPLVTQTALEASSVEAAPLVFSRHRQWIDLAHDVTLSDAELAVREGFTPVEHFKRYTTTGMSVDQGKTGNLNAFLALSKLTGRPVGEIGTTTFRPPYMPVTLGALAGRDTGVNYAPKRFLPAHQVHCALAATGDSEGSPQFGDYGGWQRPDYYALPGETPQSSIEREVRAVRATVGIFDNSPIGKIEVRGADAAEFLNRMYINKVTNLAPGRSRYGLMLNEQGIIMDDGVFTCLDEDHYLVNTTSAGVAHVLRHFERWLQCEWPELNVLVDDVTTQWANFTLAGPRARQLLQQLETAIDLSPSALPHMSAACGQLAGMPARVVRVSFSGECSFEVNVPSDRAADFMVQCLKTGAPLGITPYGIETLMVLRLEKGYMHVGSDTDGMSTPDDVGWGEVANNKPDDFIGKRSLSLCANQASGRRQLVGLLATNATQAITAGGHLLVGGNRKPPADTDGWISSAARSPHLHRHIALGLLRDGRSHLGDVITVYDQGERYLVKVVEPAFFDPDNTRLQS